MNEYSFIVEFDEMSENQINKLWEYLSERNIKFHVSKDDENIYIEYTKDDLINSYNVLLKENRILRENAENNDKVVDRVNWENQILKKQLKELEEQSANAINKQVARSVDLVNQQKEFIEWLKEKSYQTHFQLQTALIYEKVLSKYKEIIGGDNNE